MKKVIETGKFTRMSNEHYHGKPCGEGVDVIGSSDLKLLVNQSLHHLRKQLDDKQNEVSRPRVAAFDLGSAVHAYVECKDEFNKIYVPLPEDIKIRKGAKFTQWKEGLPAGAVDLTRSQYDSAIAMGEQVLKAKMVKMIKEHGQVECSFFEKITDSLFLRARPDLMMEVDEGYYLADIKTTSDPASSQAFQNTFNRLNYWVQVGLYSRIITKITGKDILGYYFVVVEKGGDHVVSTLSVEHSTISRSINEVKRGVDRIALCATKDQWPAYHKTDNVIEIGFNSYNKERTHLI